MRGNDLFDSSYRKVAELRGNDILDATYRKIGEIRGNDILDSSYRKVAEIRGSDILDSSYRRIGSLDDARNSIQGAMGGASVTVLWLFFVRCIERQPQSSKRITSLSTSLHP